MHRSAPADHPHRKVAGLERDLGLHGLQFNTCLVVFFITYILVELPSNYALKRFGGKKWLPGLVFCWVRFAPFYCR